MMNKLVSLVTFLLGCPLIASTISCILFLSLQLGLTLIDGVWCIITSFMCRHSEAIEQITWPFAEVDPAEHYCLATQTKRQAFVFVFGRFLGVAIPSNRTDK